MECLLRFLSLAVFDLELFALVLTLRLQHPADGMASTAGPVQGVATVRFSSSRSGAND